MPLIKRKAYYRSGGKLTKGTVYKRGSMGSPKKWYVDKDFATKSLQNKKNGRMKGRRFTKKGFDLTAPVRGEKGRIAHGRISLKSRNQKSAKIKVGNKTFTIPVKQVKAK